MFLDRELPQYTAEDRAIRAENAKRLLKDPFFLEIMEESEAKAMASWLGCKTVEQRERAFLLIGGIYAIMETIRTVVADAPPETE